jgi:hypothetical protein
MTLSRRGFLGAAGAAAVLPLGRFGMADAAPAALRGRVLAPITLANGGVLLPDTILDIAPVREGHAYVTTHGLVPVQSIQPLTNAPILSASVFPCDVQAVAGSAPLLAHCAVDAPLHARAEYGVVMHAMSALMVNDVRWLELADDNGLLAGWSPADAWAETRLHMSPAADRVVIDSAHLYLAVLGEGEVLMTSPIAIQRLPDAGKVVLRNTRLFSVYAARTVPFWLAGEGISLAGATWHNAFGISDAEVSGGADIHLPVDAARWLYAHCAPEVLLDVM